MPVYNPTPPPPAPPKPPPPKPAAPSVGRKKPAAAISQMAGNNLATTEDLALYVNTGRKELFTRSEELDLLAAEIHSAAVLLRKQLLKAAKKAGDRRERWAYTMMVRRSLRPLFRSARSAAAASDSAADSARMLRRFWRTYTDLTETIVPKRRGER